LKGLWDFSGVDDMCFSDSDCTSYKKAAEFLGDTVEDWGCGTAWARYYFKHYRGIDGSPHKNVDEVVDLREYTSDVDNILMRQVLELNDDWRVILDNVKKSFRKRFCLVVYTPLVGKTRVGHVHVPVKADGSRMQGKEIHEIYFNKQDILDCFLSDKYKVTEEQIKTNQGYHNEWILYVEKV